VIAMPDSSAARIALAIALSVLIHMVLLFTPMIELAPAEVPLPPLQAKLEPLPKIAPAQPKPKPKLKPAVPKPPAPIAPVAPDSEIATTQPPTAEPPAVEPEAVKTVASEVPAVPVEAANTAEEIKPAHPLPKKAQLTFAVYKGSDFRVGEARLIYQSKDQHYTLKVEANTTGVASLFKKYDVAWNSSGSLTPNGLHPDQYIDSRTSGSNQAVRTATFNWAEKTLAFSSGNSTALPDGSQDRVSFMLQMSQANWNDNYIALNITDGSKLDHYEIDIGAAETIDTHLGKIHAIPFRKRHAPHESYLDIWLGEEYRLLPVKIRQTAPDGSIEFEMVVTDIRVAEE
jgi:hypothetical protein